MSSWRRRVFNSPGLTQSSPGPYLEKIARRWKRKIYVTSAGYDDIGKVLKSMGAVFEPFRAGYDCDLLFVNCGTKDRLDPGQLRSFVQSGCPCRKRRSRWSSGVLVLVIDGPRPGRAAGSGRSRGRLSRLEAA
jgi:hypothetical protein